MASGAMERDLTQASVGYLSKEDYKRKREDLEEEKAMQMLKRKLNGAPPPAASSEDAGAEAPAAEGKKKKKKDKKKDRPSALSFDAELEEENEGVSPGAAVIGGMAAARAKEEQQKALQQEAAMREMLQQQRAMREEPLTLTYTYRSASTQRECPSGVLKGSVQIKRGFTADEAAVAVRTDIEKLGGKFAPNAVQGIREERDVLFIGCCEGVATGSFVVPGAVGLVELWNRTWSDAGPMFDEFKHGVLVTERRWYEQMRHTYPYSHWRQYDTLTEYSLKEFIANRDKPAEPFDPIKTSKAERNAAATKNRK